VMGELTAEQHETLRLHFYEGIRWQKLARNSGSPREMCGITTIGGSKNSASKCAKANCRIANWYGTYWGSPDEEVWSAMGSHEEFRELCAVSTSGDLTEEEKTKLQKHLAVCPECVKR